MPRNSNILKRSKDNDTAEELTQDTKLLPRENFLPVEIEWPLDKIAKFRE